MTIVYNCKSLSLHNSSRHCTPIGASYSALPSPQGPGYRCIPDLELSAFAQHLGREVLREVGLQEHEVSCQLACGIAMGMDAWP